MVTVQLWQKEVTWGLFTNPKGLYTSPSEMGVTSNTPWNGSCVNVHVNHIQLLLKADYMALCPPSLKRWLHGVVHNTSEIGTAWMTCTAQMKWGLHGDTHSPIEMSFAYNPLWNGGWMDVVHNPSEMWAAWGLHATPSKMGVACQLHTISFKKRLHRVVCTPSEIVITWVCMQLPLKWGLHIIPSEIEIACNLQWQWSCVNDMYDSLKWGYIGLHTTPLKCGLHAIPSKMGVVWMLCTIPLKWGLLWG